jgi:4-hydroxybenzoate polyprenyltransferase
MDGAVLYPRRFAALVKFEHTVFALPFAYVGAFLALDAVPSAQQLVWLTLAMVGARSLAMALNRLVDAGIDARNPRTAGRELPQGTLRPWQVGLFCLASLAVFLLAVFHLDPVVRWLWPIPVAMFVVYPYLKRFTWLGHFWLGAVDGLAPVGGWVAVTGELPLEAWLLGAAVATWVAGFDLFYAIFDIEVDRAQGLHSFPARFASRQRSGARGITQRRFSTRRRVSRRRRVLLVARWWQRCRVRACNRLTWRPGRLNTAFFTMNGASASLLRLCSRMSRMIRAATRPRGGDKRVCGSTDRTRRLPRGDRAERLARRRCPSLRRAGRADRGEPGGEARGIGFVGHEPLVYRELTALENLDLFGRLYAVPERRERIGMLLERFGLWEARNERVATFSRGMAQRLALCRAMLHDPGLLILDEPYSALDEAGAALLDRELGELRESRTFLVATHDPLRLASLASSALALA